MRGEPLTLALPGVCEGHVSALRVWRVSREGTLRSLAVTQEWPVERALCVREGKKFGQFGDKIGIFAFKRGEIGARNLVEQSCFFEAVPFIRLVIGEVALWGEIHEHELGYRAEYARPVSLYFMGHHAVPIRRAGARYRVPVLYDGRKRGLQLKLARWFL